MEKKKKERVHTKGIYFRNIKMLCLLSSVLAQCPLEGLGVRHSCSPPGRQHQRLCDSILPLAIAFPSSTEEVAATVRYAVERQIPFTVKGGGHSYTCQYAEEGALQISLRELNSVEVDHASNTVTAGGGAVFSEVKLALDPFEHAYAHGGCSSVGVGGFFLHGGIHASATRLTGLGNETLERITLVTGNGTVLEVSAEQKHGDLWDAVRVAGSFFGIATSLTFRFLDEPEATIFGFTASLTESDFVKTHLSLIETSRKDGNSASVTADGAGPARIFPVWSREIQPEAYLFQVSVRDNGFLPRPLRWARAAFHLESHLPFGTLPVPIPQVDDFSFGYDVTGGSWVSTFMCLGLDSENCDVEATIRLVTSHYNSHAYSETGRWCWSVFSTTTSFHEKMCFEYNCPDTDLFRREIPKVEAEVAALCPSYVKYWNVPSSHSVDKSRYFPGLLPVLEAAKQRWDPGHNLAWIE